MKINLRWYDWIVVNSSAGKDSQAMLDYVVKMADALGIKDRVVVAHCRLERGGMA
jgi:predicted phosphoadenosine phosphosulfate sulfurtransferase